MAGYICRTNNYHFRDWGEVALSWKCDTISWFYSSDHWRYNLPYRSPSRHSFLWGLKPESLRINGKAVPFNLGQHRVVSNADKGLFSLIMKPCTIVPCPCVSGRRCRRTEKEKARLERRGVPVHRHSFRLFKVGFRCCLEVSLDEITKLFSHLFMRRKKGRWKESIKREVKNTNDW